MATIKLNTATSSPQPKRKPVRRGNAQLRDRSKPPEFLAENPRASESRAEGKPRAKTGDAPRKADAEFNASRPAKPRDARRDSAWSDSMRDDSVRGHSSRRDSASGDSTRRDSVRNDSARNEPASRDNRREKPNAKEGRSAFKNTADFARAPRQRNHRWDGGLHESQDKPRFANDKTSNPTAFERGARDAKKPEKQTPREFSKPMERDTPRRGGKARDGFEAGAFNQNRATNPKFSAKPVASQPDLPRLSKLMAERGLCSRREADDWIINGWVKVNGAVVSELGSRVATDVEIEISREAKQHQAENVTILLHKPIGYVSGQAEDGYEPAVVLITPENQWQDDITQKPFKRGYLKGLAPAGRLDIDSTGLLVLTQDGRVAKALIGEDSIIEKEYLVRVQGELSEEGLKKLNFGLSLDGVKLKPAKVSWQNEDQLRFVLREGRKRQIRRMCELVGLTVLGLKRVRIGQIPLGKLPMGQWRYLRAGEKF